MNARDIESTQKKLFLGRQTEIAWITEQLAYGQQVLAICGPRYIGKSALLKELPDLLPREYLAIYLDAQKADGWDTSSPLLQIAGEIGRVVREQTTMRVDPPQVASFSEDPVSAWNAYVDLLKGQFDHRQLVLLIDNARDASSGWMPALFACSVPLVLAADHRAQLASILPEAGDPPPLIVLGTLDNESAEAMIKEKMA
ncbi:MAG: ATP-binding protein, partial [Anaerolineae bacterium]|nr:ATP-binding protein [Anaerolineae bacterium]